jgi:hypothetical protein
MKTALVRTARPTILAALAIGLVACVAPSDPEPTPANVAVDSTLSPENFLTIQCQGTPAMPVPFDMTSPFESYLATHGCTSKVLQRCSSTNSYFLAACPSDTLTWATTNYAAAPTSAKVLLGYLYWDPCSSCRSM